MAVELVFELIDRTALSHWRREFVSFSRYNVNCLHFSACAIICRSERVIDQQTGLVCIRKISVCFERFSQISLEATFVKREHVKRWVFRHKVCHARKGSSLLLHVAHLIRQCPPRGEETKTVPHILNGIWLNRGSITLWFWNKEVLLIEPGIQCSLFVASIHCCQNLRLYTILTLRFRHTDCIWATHFIIEPLFFFTVKNLALICIKGHLPAIWLSRNLMKIFAFVNEDQITYLCVVNVIDVKLNSTGSRIELLRARPKYSHLEMSGGAQADGSASPLALPHTVNASRVSDVSVVYYLWINQFQWLDTLIMSYRDQNISYLG